MIFEAVEECGIPVFPSGADAACLVSATTGHSFAAQPPVLRFQLADPGLGTTLLRHSGLALVLYPLFGPQTRLPLGVAFRLSSGAGLAFLNTRLPLLKTAFALSISPRPLAL